MAQEKGDEETAHSAVPIEEWMDGLELYVSQPGPQQDGNSVIFSVEEGFEFRHAVFDLRVGWGNEGGVARTCSTNPVLGAAKLTRVLDAAPTPREQDAVDFADEPVGKRKTLLQALEAMIEGGDVVGNFRHVLDRNARGFVQFEEEKIGKGRLGPLNLGGQDRLFANIGVKEERFVRQHGGNAIEAAQSEDG